MRLRRIEALNPSFRAFTTVDAAGARARASEVDAATGTAAGSVSSTA